MCSAPDRRREEIMRKFTAALLAGAAITLLFTTLAQAKDKIIGVSWSNFQEERWKTDEAAIKKQLEANGDKYISADAQSSAEKQLSDVESLISQGANALIVLAQDASAIGPAIQKATDEGIPVVGYDRLIENPNAFYLTFDNKEVGRMQARAVFAVKPEGNYAFIKGSSADPNADFLFSGQMEVLKDAIDSGKIKNVGEAYTDGWLPANAQKNMEQILTQNNNKVDAVVASNDGTAGGAIAALAAQGLAGSVPVSGQDGDHAALNRIALGTQTVSVWKDARELGKKAAEIASMLADGKKMTDIPGVQKFDGGPKHVEMNSIFLKPIPITKDNLDVVINAGWITKDEVCQGVKPGSVKVCG
jgi:D-xylose transport system substrate-binding protein